MNDISTLATGLQSDWIGFYQTRKIMVPLCNKATRSKLVKLELDQPFPHSKSYLIGKQ